MRPGGPLMEHPNGTTLSRDEKRAFYERRYKEMGC